MRRSRRFLAAAGVLTVLAAGAAQAAPSIAITSPAAGSTVSRANGTMTVMGTSAFDAALPAQETYYLRGSGCGATESFWLSTTTGADEYDGCGTIGGLPANEVLFQAGGNPMTFSAQDGVPVVVDASRDVTGTIRAESWTGPGTPGVGQVVVNVSLTGSTDRDSYVLGSGTFEAVNAAKDGVQFPFTFNLADELQGAQLTDLTLSVEVHGANWNSSNLGLEGASKFTLPMFDTGRVEVSDSAVFTAARRVRATIGSGGTWAAEIPVPTAGARTIYARAVQGSSTTDATPVPITVVP
jgi:hypothetical protein